MKKLLFKSIFIILAILSFESVRAQGPVIISGLDTEWGIRPANTSHGTIATWASVIQTGIINNVTNNPTGDILVIGGGKGPATTDHMTSFWNQVSTALGKNVVYSNDITADISTISFSGYSMIAVCNTADGAGKLTATELAAISARQSDVANFVNAGGGLFASSCTIAPLYGYINIGTPPLISVNGGGNGSTPTAAGIAMGIPPIAGPFHNNFTQFPSFLTVLSTLGDLDVILGGASVIIPSDDDGAYCCEGENEVVNGNFESGDTGFTSAYLQNTATYPGEYDVTTSAANFGAVITDHSFCVDPSAYASNDMFMVVNGKTQQTGSSVIWEQTLTGLEEGKEYKFCANFKDMEQCTFNIFPNITMSAGIDFVNQVIDTDDADPCDWERLEFCFIADGNPITLKIELDETGNGDGNDVAIDDIAVLKKLDPDYFITIQHQGDTNLITGSLNTMATTDDTLRNDACEFDFTTNPNPFYWFVYEPTDPNDALFANPVPLTFGWGNTVNAGGINTMPWDLTTTFPTYPFAQNTFYVIGMWIPSCCESCYTESWEYQITYNNGLMPMSGEGLSDKLKAEIKSRFVIGDGVNTRSLEDSDAPKPVSLYPNPAQDSFTVSILENTLNKVEVISMTGQIMISKKVGQEKSNETIEISNLTSGMYFVNVVGSDLKNHTLKLIKK